MNFLNNNKEKKQVYVLQLMIGIKSVVHSTKLLSTLINKPYCSRPKCFKWWFSFIAVCS